MIIIRSTYLQGASTRSINAKQNSSQIAYQKSTNQISLSKKRKQSTFSWNGPSLNKFEIVELSNVTEMGSEIIELEVLKFKSWKIIRVQIGRG